MLYIPECASEIANDWGDMWEQFSNSLRLSGNSDADKLAIYKAVPFVGTNRSCINAPSICKSRTFLSIPPA